MCFDPKYLANALDFGVTLRSGGKLHRGMAGDPSGEFCLLMSRRDSGWLLGFCVLREASGRAIEPDRRAGKWGLVAIEATGNNMIPQMVAIRLEESLGLSSTAEIVQAVKAHRSDKSGLDRIFLTTRIQRPG
jgi:hypothetical protein